MSAGEGTGMTPGSLGLTVDDETIGLPAGLDPTRTYDVHLNGQHVWSIDPERDLAPRSGRLVAAWPRALRKFLRGSADVEVHDHIDGVLVASARHVFRGEPSRTVKVTTRRGSPLILDKWGRLIRPLSADSDEAIVDLLQQTDDLLTVLRDQCGVPAFISYGTLLGAARAGRLIGHDNDVDLAYVSEHGHPVDVVRETFRIERVLAEHGWVVRRGSGTRLNVRLPGGDGSIRFVDVFAAHWVDGVLYMPSDTGFRLPRETILPLTTLDLHGRPMPAPRDYERLLTETYGEGWRVPDPSFQYRTPRWLERRLEGWFGGLHPDRKQWDVFYATQPGRRLPRRPSQFARWVQREYPASRPLVDLGTGTARDARYFAARHGRPVAAVDYSFTVLGRPLALPPDVRLTRSPLNLNDLREVLAFGHVLSRTPEPVDLYGRFLLHALDPSGRENTLRLASMALRRGGHLFLEFRTPLDRGQPKAFRRAGRRFLDPDTVVAQIEAAGGRVVHRAEGTGLARFRREDPHVCRLVATWAGEQEAASA